MGQSAAVIDVVTPDVDVVLQIMEEGTQAKQRISG